MIALEKHVTSEGEGQVEGILMRSTAEVLPESTNSFHILQDIYQDVMKFLASII